MTADQGNNDNSSVNDRDELVSRIDELEQLLAEKKAEANQAGKLHMKVGTDGIPVLEDQFEPDSLGTQRSSTERSAVTREHEIVEEIIDKVDREISQDLDELIAILKNSIIDEVKTRLMHELSQPDRQDSDK